MTDKELMLKGELYIHSNDPQLAKDCARSRRIRLIEKLIAA